VKALPALLLLVLAACGTPASSSRRLKPETLAPAEAWKGVGRLAVLPPDNWTAHVGPEYQAWYRAVMAELLREKGYAVTPVVDVNRFMLKNKFTLAGEIRLYSVQELREEFRADALLFWDITGDGRINMDLVKGDGQRLWSTGEIYLDLPYVARPAGSYSDADHRFALALAEILRKLPGKVQ
jgi:hypothetical protein